MDIRCLVVALGSRFPTGRCCYWGDRVQQDIQRTINFPSSPKPSHIRTRVELRFPQANPLLGEWLSEAIDISPSDLAVVIPIINLAPSSSLSPHLLLFEASCERGESHEGHLSSSSPECQHWQGSISVRSEGWAWDSRRQHVFLSLLPRCAREPQAHTYLFYTSLSHLLTDSSAGSALPAVGPPGRPCY